MSDFLSNFTNNHDEKKEKEIVEAQEAATEEEKLPKSVEKSENEDVEFDPTYKKRKQKKIVLISIVGIFALIVVLVAYYQTMHVKVPDFQRQEIAKAREWGVKEEISLKIESTHSFKIATNKVIHQSTDPEKKIKKGETLVLTVSLGPDPNEQLELPDFETISLIEVRAWTKQEKAENVSVIEQYHDKIPKGGFIKKESANKELKLQNYKRKDRLIVYYSKGNLRKKYRST